MVITAIIPHFHAARVPNLREIASSLERRVDELIIWNNDAPLEITFQPFVRVIQSPGNFGCQGRFAAVFQADIRTDYFLFHDNDLVASWKSLDRMIDASQATPRAIITAVGEKRQFEGRDVTIAFGKYELVPKTLMFQLLTNWENSEESLHDDIWLSVQAEKMNIPRLITKVKWKNFHDKLGMWQQKPWKKWQQERQQVFETLMRKWVC